MTRITIICISFIIVSLMFAGQSYAQIDPETVVGIWLFDEGEGDVAKDSSGNGNDGTLNGPEWTNESKFGGALEFDGAGSYIEFATGESMKTPHFTIMAWFNTRKLNGYGHIFQTGNDWNDIAGYVFRVHQDGFAQSAVAFGPGNTATWVDSPALEADTWYHLALTFDGTTVTLYLDGENVASGAGQGEIMYDNQPVRIGVHSQDTGAPFDGFIDEVALFDVALEAEDIEVIMNEGLSEIVGGPPVAVNPQPANGATDVPRDVVLSWEPGEFAAPTNGHKVYFGESFNDVNDATGAVAQSANSYTPPQRLDINTTYYWRVDEVNAPPTSHIEFKGEVWQFTTEPIAYAIENITATSSSSSVNMEHDKTVDGSGLNDSDQHSTEAMDMWLSNMTGPQPTWIQYELDRAYKVYEMWVWNSNQSVEAFVGFGAKDVTIEHSEDGAAWTALGDAELARATGTADYTYNTTVDFGGALAKYVRINVHSNWGGITTQYGLSEVRFFYIPVHAREPKPASGDADVARDVVLDWRAGREAASHEISFSSDEEAVINGTAPVDVATESRYQPGLLDFGQTYYWKVNEVNDTASPSSWEGDLWSFSTIEYFVVDDFEDYDVGNNEIWWAWKDGIGYASHPTEPPYAGNGTGSMVGDETTDSYTEETIVHSGNQSMPLFYDNNKQGKFKYSEAEMALSATRDWTEGGATELSLWFHGEPNNAAEPMYVALNGNAIVYNDNPDAALITEWTQWNIDLQAFADQGVNLTNVNTIALGLGDKTNPQPGGAGKMYFDDIRVGHPRPPVGLVAHYALENNAEDSSGNEHHGTIVGGPVFVEGPAGLGMALEFDGTGSQYVDLGNFNPSVVTGQLSVSLWAKWNGLTTAWQGLIGKRIGPWEAEGMMWQIEAHQTTGAVRFQREGTGDVWISDGLPIGEWQHVAVTFDGTTARTYINGAMTNEDGFSFGSDTEAPFQFGSSTSGGGNPFNGALDDIRIYDIVLSDAEILELAGK